MVSKLKKASRSKALRSEAARIEESLSGTDRQHEKKPSKPWWRLEWVCPLGDKTCKKNCGNYGCGN